MQIEICIQTRRILHAVNTPGNLHAPRSDKNEVAVRNPGHLPFQNNLPRYYCTVHTSRPRRPVRHTGHPHNYSIRPAEQAEGISSNYIFSS